MHGKIMHYYSSAYGMYFNNKRSICMKKQCLLLKCLWYIFKERSNLQSIFYIIALYRQCKLSGNVDIWRQYLVSTVYRRPIDSSHRFLYLSVKPGNLPADAISLKCRPVLPGKIEKWTIISFSFCHILKGQLFDNDWLHF